MKSINKHIIVGNVAFDPSIKTTQQGVRFATLRVVTNYRKRDGDNFVEDSDGHNVVCWDKLADVVERYVTKGKKIYVEGPSRNREYTDGEGNKKFIVEIIARELVIMSAPGNHGDGQEDVPF